MFKEIIGIVKKLLGDDANSSTDRDKSDNRMTRLDLKSRAEKMLLPSFYFKQADFDERRLRWYNKFISDRTLLTVGPDQFTLRRLDDYLIFADKNLLEVKECFYLPGLLPVPEQISQQQFEYAYKKGLFGRCLLYIDERMNSDEAIYLILLFDGSGFALHLTGWVYGYQNNSERYFKEVKEFNWREFADFDPTQIMSRTYEELMPLCQQLFDKKINRRLVVPYLVATEIENIPFSFLKGSEAELKHLTRIFCITEPHLFDDQQPVEVIYRAALPNRRGGMERVIRHNRIINSGRLMSLCDLAFRLNQFTGQEWQHAGNSYRGIRPNRRTNFSKKIERITVQISPPSMHERAEGLILLSEWLDIYLNNEQKRKKLLGIE